MSTFIFSALLNANLKYLRFKGIQNISIIILCNKNKTKINHYENVN